MKMKHKEKENESQRQKRDYVHKKDRLRKKKGTKKRIWRDKI